MVTVLFDGHGVKEFRQVPTVPREGDRVVLNGKWHEVCSVWFMDSECRGPMTVRVCIGGARDRIPFGDASIEFSSSLERPPILVAVKGRNCEGEYVVDYGIITTDRAKAEAWMAEPQADGYTLRSFDDGEIYPSL